MEPKTLKEALQLAPLPYAPFQNLEQEDYFQPYSIAHLLTRSDGSIDERWEENIQRRAIRGFGSCDLWNFDWFISYLVAHTAHLILEEKVVPVDDTYKPKEWAKNFIIEVESIDSKDLLTGIRDRILMEFFGEILPSLPRSNQGEYKPKLSNRNTGISETDYGTIGSHIIYVICSGMEIFFNELDKDFHKELKSSIQCLRNIEKGIYPSIEETATLACIIPALWV